MPKRRKYEIIHCQHFKWRLISRQGVWYADGRSNIPNAGRHSLGTRDKEQALNCLPELDRSRAVDLGLAPQLNGAEEFIRPLPLEEGRRLYEEFVKRPRVAGGVRKSTSKRYRAVFDKFLPFAASRGTTVWNGVTANLLTDYAAHLEKNDYAHKTLVNELTTLKQAIRWLIEEGHLRGVKPIELKLRKAESERAYCWRPQEVNAMVKHCGGRSLWLRDVIIALACTGLRISELASLRWADLDLDAQLIRLTDETARRVQPDRKRRELKSGRSRSFPIHADLLTVLERMSCREGFVFRGPRGGHLKPDTVRRILIREVLEPLAEQFPVADGGKGFRDGRLHSFRHYFCSTCANSSVPERMVMEWLGHQDSEMVRHYYHLHDEEARRRMAALDFLGGAGGRSTGADV